MRHFTNSLSLASTVSITDQGHSVLEQIRCPALLLTGREDGWSGPAQHSGMAAKIAGSHLVIVPDCGHMSMLERPAEVSAALRTWLLRA